MRRDLLLALLTGSLAGVVYALGSAPGMLFGDGGELQFAAWIAGLPHPTGYPLYMTLGWAWSHFLHATGLASPARAMTLLSVLFAALAVGLTYLFARSLVALSLPQAPAAIQRVTALLAALTFAFTPTFWSQAVVAEVYTLHALFVALILGLAVGWGRKVASGGWGGEGGEWRVESGGSQTSSIPVSPPSTPPSPSSTRPPPLATSSSAGLDPLLAALALTFGLSLAHHRTTLLLAPFLVGFLAWQAPAGYWRRHRRDILWLAWLALVPLVLYLYVPLRANATPYLTIELLPGQPVSLLDRSPAGLANYLLGQGFAGELQGLPAALAAAPSQAGRFLAELTLPGVALAVLGVAALIARRRWSLLWLTGGSFLALAAFNLVYTIGDIAVFYIPCYLIACVWIGVAAAWLATLISTRFPGVVGRARQEEQQRRHASASSAGIALLVAMFLLPAYLLASHAAAANRSQDTRAGDWWQSLLAANPPQGALLVSNDRDEMTPLWYLQQVEGVRPDLAGVFPLLLPGAGWQTVGQVVDSALATGRPVSLIKPMPGLEIKAQLGEPDPSGLTPVLGPAVGALPAGRADIFLGDAVRLAGDAVDPPAPQSGQTVAVDLYWQPVRALPTDYTSFVQLLLPDGSKIAQSDHRVGGVYYPSSLWQPGETLLDRHTLSIPTDTPPGPYHLLVGLYELVNGEVQTLGEVVLDH